MKILLFALVATISIPAALAMIVVHLIAIILRRQAERSTIPRPTKAQEEAFELRMQEHRFAVVNRGVTGA